MKSLIKDNKGNANVIIMAMFIIITGFALLIFGTNIYYNFAKSADASNIIGSPGVSATGRWNISGNVSNGDLVNITNGGTYIFEFNTSVASPSACATTNCIVVNVYNSNTSLGAVTNLTAAINGNSTNATLTASTLAGSNGYNYTVVTYKTHSTTGNSVVLSDTGTNIASTGLSGGVNDVTGAANQNSLNSYANVVFPIFGLGLMILGFGVILITIKGFGRHEER